MKKTRHQMFVEQLQKQLTNKAAYRSGVLGGKYGELDENKEDIMKEIERRFDELFSSFDDEQ